MKRLMLLGMACLLALGPLVQAQETVSKPAKVTLYVFEENSPVKDFQVWVGKDVTLDSAQANDYGAATLMVPPGRHQMSVARTGYENAIVNLNVSENERLQVIVTQYPGNPVPHVSLESSEDGKRKNNTQAVKLVGKPGIMKARIVNSENGEGVEGARIFFSGLPVDFVTDKDGYFEAQVPSSTYSISILHNRFASQTVDDIQILEKQTTEKQFEVTPAGIALKEFVVVAPFIQGSVSSLVDERKETNVVSDFVGAEQMAKSGDSDAAAALTRVAGLTLIDGKYAVVRGMEDRYTTVLMNGALMRSPDPSSKSVDLDLFPASILDSIEVQKTYSADVPGAFGGGVIKLRTKSLPEDDFFKLSVSLGGNTETTGKDIISHEGGDTDWLGFDDGTREMPVDPDNPAVATNPENSEYDPTSNTLIKSEAEKFARRYDTTMEAASPDLGLSVSFGQLGRSSSWKYGYQAYLGYSNKWSYKTGEKNTFAAGYEGLTKRNDQDFEKSENSIDLTALLVTAIETDGLRLKSTTSLIRKSSLLTRRDTGLDAENSDYVDIRLLDWTERQLITQQFNGEHSLFWGSELDWTFGVSVASMDTPDRISYRYDDVVSDDPNNLYLRNGNTYRHFLELQDDNTTMGFDYRLPFTAFEVVEGQWKAGFSFESTSRTSDLTRFDVDWGAGDIPPVNLVSLQSPNEIFAPENLTGPEYISQEGFVIIDKTQFTDSYTAERDTTGFYTSLQTTWFEDFDLEFGVRNETFNQTANTRNDFNEVVPIELSTTDMLPSLLATYRVMDGLQIRMALAETVNRPNILELTPFSWVDPTSGDRVIGNSRLKSANISHFDLRLELYGQGANTVSFAFFTKDFTSPIEQTVESASGGEEVTTYQNATSATNSGFELDFRWDLDFIDTGSYLFGMNGNYSSITSEVVLPAGNIEYSNERPMQGQSPYTMNFMLTMDNDALGLETALIFNEIGERITKVGQGDIPHIYEQPFTALDFTLSKDLGDGKASFKLKNILNEDRVYLQGDQISQTEKKGMSLSFGYSQTF